MCSATSSRLTIGFVPNAASAATFFRASRNAACSARAAAGCRCAANAMPRAASRSARLKTNFSAGSGAARISSHRPNRTITS